MASQRLDADPRVVRNRHRALETAVEMLVADGPDELTQANVAEQSGVSRATVYRLWPDRGQLVLDSMARVVDMAHTTPGGTDLLADLTAEVLSLARQLHGPLRLVTASLIEQAQDDPDMAAALARLERSGTRVTRQLLRAAAEQGRLSTGTSVDDATSLIVGAVVHRVLVMGRSLSPATARRLAEALVSS